MDNDGEKKKKKKPRVAVGIEERGAPPIKIRTLSVIWG